MYGTCTIYLFPSFPLSSSPCDQSISGCCLTSISVFHSFTINRYPSIYTLINPTIYSIPQQFSDLRSSALTLSKPHFHVSLGSFHSCSMMFIPLSFPSQALSVSVHNSFTSILTHLPLSNDLITFIHANPYLFLIQIVMIALLQITLCIVLTLFNSV